MNCEALRLTLAGWPTSRRSVARLAVAERAEVVTGAVDLVLVQCAQAIAMAEFKDVTTDGVGKMAGGCPALTDRVVGLVRLLLADPSCCRVASHSSGVRLPSELCSRVPRNHLSADVLHDRPSSRGTGGPGLAVQALAL